MAAEEASGLEREVARDGGGGPPWRSRNVLALGVVSLLTDIASEMIAPLLPLFLATSLGAGPAALGFVEGVADLVASFVKLWAGALSDRAKSRKGLVAWGYAIAAVARPLVALAGSAWHVVAIRALDRIGKGLRTAPRDALLAEAVPSSRRAAAFGFHRAMDHAGAVLGPLVALLLLTQAGLELRTVFALALVPGALSLCVLAWKVREAPRAIESTPRGPLFAPPAPGEWRLLLPIALYTLAAASDLFIVLRVQELLGVEGSLAALPLLWVALHLVKSASSWFLGRLGDRRGHGRVMAAGFLVLAVACTGLAFASTPQAALAFALLHGVHTGLVEGPQRALVAGHASAHLRGGAFGRYHLVAGALALPASAGFGILWQWGDAATAFLPAAGLAACAAACAARLAGTVKQT
ncbi:MAG: MFS transporter [Planctomycetia bacterium]